MVLLSTVWICCKKTKEWINFKAINFITGLIKPRLTSNIESSRNKIDGVDDENKENNISGKTLENIAEETIIGNEINETCFNKRACKKKSSDLENIAGKILKELEKENDEDQLFGMQIDASLKRLPVNLKSQTTNTVKIQNR